MMETGTKVARPLGWLLLGAAAAQIAAPVVQSLVGASEPGEGSEDLLITPAGWTFSIWSLIYLLAVAHAVVTLRWGTGTDQPRRFTRDLALLYVGAAVWIVLSSVGSSWGTFAALAVMTALALDAARIAARSGPPMDAPAWTGTLARATSGLYAGWVSAAVFLNLSTALIESDIADSSAQLWQIGLLVVALGVAFLVDRWLGRGLAYPAALAWASLGIAVAVREVSTPAFVIAVVGAVGFGARALLRWRGSAAAPGDAGSRAAQEQSTEAARLQGPA